MDAKAKGTEVARRMLVEEGRPHAGRLPRCTIDWVFASRMVISDRQALLTSAVSCCSVRSTSTVLWYARILEYYLSGDVRTVRIALDYRTLALSHSSKFERCGTLLRDTSL